MLWSSGNSVLVMLSAIGTDDAVPADSDDIAAEAYGHGK